MRDFSSHPRRRGPSAREWALLATGAVPFLAAAGLALAAWHDQRQAQAEVRAIREERDAAATRLRTLEQELRRDSVAAQAWLTVEAPPPRVVADLSELLPPEVRLDALNLRYGSRVEVEMAVAARRPAAYDLFLERLAASPRFTEVVPGNESREGEVRAEVRASYHEGSP